MEKLMIRGDRLVLALDVLQFLHEQEQPGRQWINARRFSKERAYERLCALEPDFDYVSLQLELGMVAPGTFDPALALYPQLNYLHWFLRENEGGIACMNVDVTALFKNKGLVLQKVIRAFASGEITEEMLKEEPAATAAQ